MSGAKRSTATTDVGGRTDISRGGFNRGRRVCVVGGGLGGLTAALAFAQSGAEVEVFERAPRISEVGAGIQITPNGGRVLAALGMNLAMKANALAAQMLKPTDGLTGKTLARFDLTAGDRPPYLLFHRAALIDCLLAHCEGAGVRVHLGREIGEELPGADLVVGADGIRSVTRPRLNGQDDPFFTGQVAWRAVIPMAGLPPVIRLWLAPGRHVVSYPLDGDRLNIVAVHERRDWAAEGWDHADDPMNMRQAFHGLSPRVTGILQRVEEVRLWGLFRHPVAERWHGDGLALIGDAAHPTLPFLAQGANLAIEDAFVLAQECDLAEDVSKAIALYQARRRPRVERAIAAANANARNYHLGGLPRAVAHLGIRALGAMAPTRFLGRYDWLHGFDATVRPPWAEVVAGR